MYIKKPKGILKSSIIMMDFMSGEDKMFYLERMWDLYFKVYKNKKYSAKAAKTRKYPVMREKKAYELCSELTKIFGH